jgi:tetratricopeptide (TPR) repeat protein
MTTSGRPVLNLSLAINYAISGTAVWSYHAANLAIHALAGLALFGIVRRTLRGRTAIPHASPPAIGAAQGVGINALHATLIAFSAALLWTLHPLTESVTYIVQRAESLMGLFYLLTLYCFIRAAEAVKPARSLWFALCIAACVLGMATKEVMVSAPLIVLLYDRTFLAGTFRDAWRIRRWLYAALAASWLLLAGLIAATGGNRSGSIGFGIGIPWWKYTLTQARAICTYLGLSFFPHPLNFDRSPYSVHGVIEVLPYAIPVVALLVGTVVALWRRPAVGFLGCWFFAILAPTSSIVPGTNQLIVEHRMYLPLAAVVVMAVLGTCRLLNRRSTTAFVVLAIAFGLATSARNADYRSELSLWGDAVAKDPASYVAQNNLGLALAKISGHLDEAIARYEEALRLEPGYVDAHNNLGNALQQMPGRLPDVIVHYEEAIRLNPNIAEVHCNLGRALTVEGRIPEAIAELETAVTLNPSLAASHLNLAIALLKTAGRPQEAAEHLRAVLRIQPGFEPARQILARIQASQP